jgi:hypothetical protein
LDAAPFYWAISHSVGYGCKNRLEDVQLVQFFLNRIVEGKRKDGFDTRKGITIDGKFGGETWGAIKWFQKSLSVMVVADGMVSAASGKDEYTKKQKRGYTIHWLNSMYSGYYRHYYSDLRRDPLLPGELCNQLSGPLKDL